MQTSDKAVSPTPTLEQRLEAIARETALLRGRLEAISDDRWGPLGEDLDGRLVELEETFAETKRVCSRRAGGGAAAARAVALVAKLEGQVAALRAAFENLERGILSLF